MKYFLFLFCLLCIQPLFCQNKPVDSLLQKLAVEKNEDKKVVLIVNLFLTGLDKDPYLTIQTGQSVLKQGQESNDLIKQASAYCILGTGYRISGNPIRGLQLQQKALQLAEKANNYSLLAMVKNQMAHTYRDREECDNAFKIYADALNDADREKNEVIKYGRL